MNGSFESPLGFSMVLKSVWPLWLMPLSLLLCVSIFLGRRRSSSSIVARAIARSIRAQGIPLYRRHRMQLSHELTRARRYKRPLTIVNVGLEDALNGTNGYTEADGAAMRLRVQRFNFVLPLTGFILRDTLRESDLVTYDATKNQFIILLVETTKPQAMQAVERLMKLISTRSLASFKVGIAEFPSDGLTIEDLVRQAGEASALWQ